MQSGQFGKSRINNLNKLKAIALDHVWSIGNVEITKFAAVQTTSATAEKRISSIIDKKLDFFAELRQNTPLHSHISPKSTCQRVEQLEVSRTKPVCLSFVDILAHNMRLLYPFHATFPKLSRNDDKNRDLNMHSPYLVAQRVEIDFRFEIV